MVIVAEVSGSIAKGTLPGGNASSMFEVMAIKGADTRAQARLERQKRPDPGKRIEPLAG